MVVHVPSSSFLYARNMCPGRRAHSISIFSTLCTIWIFFTSCKLCWIFIFGILSEQNPTIRTRIMTDRHYLLPGNLGYIPCTVIFEKMHVLELVESFMALEHNNRLLRFEMSGISMRSLSRSILRCAWLLSTDYPWSLASTSAVVSTLPMPSFIFKPL